jgi:hypothetical protein
MCPIKASIVGGAEVAFEQLLGFLRIFCRRGSFGQIKPATPLCDHRLRAVRCADADE